MNRAELDRFSRRAASQRTSLFSTRATYNGGEPFNLSLTGVRSTKMLVEGGFEMTHDAIARVERWPGISFSLGKKITIFHTGKEYRIDEILDHPLNPEWRLGLKQL